MRKPWIDVSGGLLVLLLVACGSEGGGGAQPTGHDMGLSKGAGAEGCYFAQSPDSDGQDLQTR